MQFILDCKLWSAITIEADSLEEAEKKAIELTEKLDCAEINVGCWTNGDPIIMEASIEGFPDISSE